MIIDCHGHYTTAPKELNDFRDRQLARAFDGGKRPTAASLEISDDQIRESLEGAQLRIQRERGTDLTLLSPRAAGMAHHLGDAKLGEVWAQVCNDLVHRCTLLYPENFAAVCQLPQVPGVPAANCIPELRRCVEQMGFVGLNLNPDPSGGHWSGPPLSDRSWYPLYEAMCELDVPAMIHTSASCNPAFHHSGAHFINGDTTAFMQFLTSDLFRDFPALRFIIPHGGGAVPYHWGRYRGMSLDMKRGELSETLLKNIYFDTCVYHLPGVELLTRVIPADNVLFASEVVGAVKGIDPATGRHFDDTMHYFDQLAGLSEADRHKIFEGNARRVFPRLNARLKAQDKEQGRPQAAR